MTTADYKAAATELKASRNAFWKEEYRRVCQYPWYAFARYVHIKTDGQGRPSLIRTTRYGLPFFIYPRYE